jgi:hypothetical protein
MGPKLMWGLDAFKKGKICPCRDSSHLSVVVPVAQLLYRLSHPITFNWGWYLRGLGLIKVVTVINLYEPCVLYIVRAHRYPPNTPLYIFLQQNYVLNFLNMLHTLRFFTSKFRLFHNATFFGSCIIRILHTGCAKI